MKRADLVVGEAYYLATEADWRNDPSSGLCAVIVDAGYWTWGPVKCAPDKRAGAGVLADVSSKPGGDTHREVVQLGHLRGLFDHVLAAILDRPISDEVMAEARRAELAGQARSVVSMLHHFGVVSAGVLPRDLADGPGRWIRLQAAELEPLLLAWRHPGSAS